MSRSTLKVGIVGAGSIGWGLAYAAASRRITVVLIDIAQTALDKAMAEIAGLANGGVRKGKITQQQADAIVGNITATQDYGQLVGCNLVIESASEDLAIKRRVLARIEQAVAEDCIIGFTTSSLTRAAIVEYATCPERCLVMHPFYPAWRKPVMEVVHSGNPLHDERAEQYLIALGKVPIAVQDVPCLAGNRIFCGLMQLALLMVHDNFGTVAQINAILRDRLGGGGVFFVHDLIPGSNGLTAHCLEELAVYRHNSWWQPHQLLLDAAHNHTPWLKADDDSNYTVEQADEVMDAVRAYLLTWRSNLLDDGVIDSFDLHYIVREALGFELPVPEGEQVRRDVKVEIDQNGIAVVTIFRPPVNPLSSHTITELMHAFNELENNKRVRGIILLGWNGVLAGADVKELALQDTPAKMEAFPLAGQALTLLIQTSAKPVIGVVNGPCLGGGCELMMACHLCLLGVKAMVGQPEVNLGIIPGYGGTQRLPRIVGVAAAAELLRTGSIIDAVEAMNLGWGTLVTHSDTAKLLRFVKDLFQDGGDILKQARDKAQQQLGPMDPADLVLDLPVDIGNHSRAIDVILLDVMHQGLVLPIPSGLTIEAEGCGRVGATEDCRIGLQNFLETGGKRPAQFRHR